MKIYNLDTANKDLFLAKDDNNREIYIFDLNNIQFINDLYYPNVLAFSQEESKIYNPIREKIMSLKNLSNKSTYDSEIQKTIFLYIIWIIIIILFMILYHYCMDFLN